jgi:MFS family permease
MFGRGFSQNVIVAQALVNIGAGLGAISGPLIIGALVNADAHQGWRTFYVFFTSHSPGWLGTTH